MVLKNKIDTNEFIKNLKYFWKFAKHQKRLIILYVIMGIIRAILGIITPIISAKLILDLTSNMINQFILISLLLALINMALDVFSYFSNLLAEKIYRSTFINIETTLGSEILKLSNKSLDKEGSGPFISRLNGDTSRLADIYLNLSGYLTSIFKNIGILVSILIISPIMFIAGVIIMIIRFLIENKRLKIKNENDKIFREHKDKVTGFTSEIVRGAEDIKMLNSEKSFMNSLYDKITDINDESYRNRKTNLNYLLMRWLFSDASHFIYRALIGVLIIFKNITIPYAVVLNNYYGSYNILIQNIVYLFDLIQGFNISATRVFDILESSKYDKEKFGKKHLDHVKGDFEFKNVTFRYDKRDILKNLSFKVHANETVAFVGKSGAGKTTIFNLLCKMYDNYTGKITIDGVDIKELDKDSIRGNITIVSQNPYIFNLSIRDNLKLVKEDLTDEEMVKACHMACLDDFIEKLPNKYDTIVGEGGVMLSGGEKQRLAIARAFIQKTEIILFDEATSALDNETQMKIQKAIDNLQENYTILIIAHRLSTITNASRILVLDGGKIVGEGTHQELLKTNKTYKNLYENEINKDD